MRITALSVTASPATQIRKLVALWIVFITLAMIVDRLNVDLAVADFIYRLGGNQWLWRDSFFTSVAVHKWGKWLSIAMALTAIAALLASYRLDRLRPWRKPLAYLLASISLSTLSVSILKHITAIPCPWDLIRYGGAAPYFSLWHHTTSGSSGGACFPAGHASAGYAWIALMFFFRHTSLPNRQRWQWLGLAIGLTLGLIFGIGQQLRGAHFLSHDLWTLMICWTASASTASVMFAAQPFLRQDAAIDSPVPQGQSYDFAD